MEGLADGIWTQFEELFDIYTTRDLNGRSVSRIHTISAIGRMGYVPAEITGCDFSTWHFPLYIPVSHAQNSRRRPFRLGASQVRARRY